MFLSIWPSDIYLPISLYLCLYFLGSLMKLHSFRDIHILMTRKCISPAQTLPWMPIINPTDYLTPPHEYQTGISNLSCLKLNSWYSSQNLLIPWSLLSQLIAIPSFICSGQKPWSHPWFLSLTLHIWSISNPTDLISYFILNSITFCHLCCHHPGMSHYTISSGQLQQPTSRSPCFSL